MLALLAQLLMVQISTGHLLRMLGADAIPPDICSAQAVSLSQPEGERNGGGSHEASPLPCPVCGVATASLALFTPVRLASIAPQPALALSITAALPLRDSRLGSLRPPAQAPPLG